MHDYQISWDYMEDDFIEKKNLIILNKIVKDIKKQLMPMQGFKGYKNQSFLELQKECIERFGEGRSNF